MGRALYLCVHHGKTVHAFRIDLVSHGNIVDHEVMVSPYSLVLEEDSGGSVEFVIDGDDFVRIRGNGVGLRLEMPAESRTFAYQLPEAWAFNFSTYQFQLALEMLHGKVNISAPWEKGKGFCWETTHAVADIIPAERGCFEVAIVDFLTTWINLKDWFLICAVLKSRKNTLSG